MILKPNKLVGDWKMQVAILSECYGHCTAYRLTGLEMPVCEVQHIH